MSRDLPSLARAFSSVDRSYIAAKQSLGRRADALLAQGPLGPLVGRPDLAHAKTQYEANRSWTFAAVKLISQTIAGQKINVGVERNGETQMLDSHPLGELLRDPSDLHTRWSLLYASVASLLLTGRALWWVAERQAIFHLPTHWLTTWEGSARITAWRIRPPGQTEETRIPSEQTVLFALPDPMDPHKVLSPLQAAHRAVSIDDEILKSQLTAFERGIHPSHMVIVGSNPVEGVPVRPRLTAPQQRQIIEAIRKRYSGSVNSGEPIVCDGLIERVERLSSTPSEMNWTESAAQIKQRIYESFSLNPIIAGQVESANRASSFSADKHFAQYCINPLVQCMNASLTEWFRPMYPETPNLLVEIEELMPDDTESSIKFLDLLAKHGAIRMNELRRAAPFDLDEAAEFEQPTSTEQATLQRSLDDLKSAMGELRDDDARQWGNRLARLAGSNGRH